MSLPRCGEAEGPSLEGRHLPRSTALVFDASSTLSLPFDARRENIGIRGSYRSGSLYFLQLMVRDHANMSL